MRMNYRSMLLLLMLPFLVSSQDLRTVFEKNNNQTATFTECMDYYRTLDHRFKSITMIKAGRSDVSYPIELVIVDRDGFSRADQIRAKSRAIVWINNGIHPGEPEGIDASMMLARDLVTRKEYKGLLDKVSIVIVPVYNIGGCLRRNNTSRTNQNGPEFYGFRGNNNYLDLNRDFIKQDSRNAKTFAKTWQAWQPDVFVDTHTTDGADYPYAISVLPGMRGKLGNILGDYLYDKMLPQLYDGMKNAGEEMIPYVEFRDRMEDGVYAFYDKPRFSSGYAALYHSIPFVIETHMLKPFARRVQATSLLLWQILQYTAAHQSEIKNIRTASAASMQKSDHYPIRWKLDAASPKMMAFRSFGTKSIYYPVLCDSLYCYDPQSGLQQNIPYYENYIPELIVSLPDYYIIPQAYEDVIRSLQRNGVHFTRLSKDSLVRASYYRLGDFKTVPTPYENHYLHTNLQVTEESMSYPYLKGDVLVPVRQESMQWIIQTLEPQAEDSYFAWNFFDGVLMRKEYYSDYAFAPFAEQEISSKPELAKAYKSYLTSDSSSARRMADKLEFVYYRSRFSEPYYRLYPVARIFNAR
ncbi:MAG TPA: M14 family zinc carboxypeptidase [Saprospiraceae bacterium]|nr:M14 family zinc carboxypeptidase [Saprospiraceae bacterium]